MPEDRVPLFVRLPREQAVALDRLAGSTGRRKQHLVSELLADRLAVGRIESLDPALGAQEVMSLEEAADLLRVSVEDALACARSGELPGRMLGQQWRFSRTALLAWLAGADHVQS